MTIELMEKLLVAAIESCKNMKEKNGENDFLNGMLTAYEITLSNIKKEGTN